MAEEVGTLPAAKGDVAAFERALDGVVRHLLAQWTPCWSSPPGESWMPRGRTRIRASRWGAAR
ncbi:hypothetical protein [Streptomyces sp. NPDC007905]|uniref:hypothetical protein n=1 Tax=Streptomyces sp. NPDC007905 TaxID=3364788 RepID=UPI0036E00568